MAAWREWLPGDKPYHNKEMTCAICESRKAKRACPAVRSQLVVDPVST